MELNHVRWVVLKYARVAELADALDLGSSSGNGVGVQISPLAPHISYHYKKQQSCVGVPGYA